MEQFAWILWIVFVALPIAAGLTAIWCYFLYRISDKPKPFKNIF